MQDTYIILPLHFSLTSPITFSAVPYGNHGCHGGNMYDAFLYVISNEGVDKESSYAFRGKVSASSCLIPPWPH